MSEIIYNNNEEQFLDLRFIFKTKMSPGNKKHLSVVFEEFLKGKGIKMEDESHKIEII